MVTVTQAFSSAASSSRQHTLALTLSHILLSPPEHQVLRQTWGPHCHRRFHPACPPDSLGPGPPVLCPLVHPPLLQCPRLTGSVNQGVQTTSRPDWQWTGGGGTGRKKLSTQAHVTKVWFPQREATEVTLEHCPRPQKPTGTLSPRGSQQRATGVTGGVPLRSGILACRAQQPNFHQQLCILGRNQEPLSAGAKSPNASR